MLHGALENPQGADCETLLLLLPPSGNSCKKKVEISSGRNINLGYLQNQNWFIFWERPLRKKVMLAVRGPTPASGDSSLKHASLFFLLSYWSEYRSMNAFQSSKDNSCACLWDNLTFFLLIVMKCFLKSCFLLNSNIYCILLIFLLPAIYRETKQNVH